MCVGMQQQIHYMVYPNDADDREDLIWECANEQVVDISKDGTITAVGAGNCRISLSSKNVKQFIEITVKVQIDSIELSLSDYECYIGDKREIEVFMEPQEAYDMSYVWRTTDKNIAVLEIDQEEIVYVHAVGIGSCTVYIESGDGNASEKFNIKVKSTFEKEEYKHTWLRKCALSFFVTSILFGLSFVWPEVAITYIVGVIFTVWCAIKTVMTKSEDWFWAILLVIICVLSIPTLMVWR